MKKLFKKWGKSLKKEVRSHWVIYILLVAILAVGFFLRVYRIGELLGFYFDQGRDALVIWNLWHKGDFFLVGPTTGIAGILRGPYYYYLIAPFYLLGGGNPIWPSIFLSSTTIIASLFIYCLGARIHSRTTGLIAATISAFSFNLVITSRWLSNPTPMLLLSVLLVWMMLLVTEGKKWAWGGIAFVSGLSLFHFGSAGEVFYFLAIVIFMFWQRKNLPDKKILKYSIGIFLVTVLPLIVFDIKNNGIILENIKKFLIKDGSFRLVTWREISDRFEFYYSVFSRLIFHARYDKETFLFWTVIVYFIYKFKKLWKNKGVKILLLLLGSLVFGFTFFQGNFGNIYDYYLTGYFLLFVLIFSIALGEMFKTKLGKLFVIYFFITFFVNSTAFLKIKLSDKVDAPTSVALKNQLQSIDWIFGNAQGETFNVDVYVPPVLPFAYDYLLLWQATNRCGDSLCGMELEERVDTLYTLYEQDPPHPERLEAWLARQKGIGEVEEEIRFNGITVQRRLRILP